MVSKKAEQSALVKVLSVRVQSRNGVIFRGQRITETGEIVDTHNELTVSLHARAVGVKVMTGQWWQIRGFVKSTTFINAGGFEMTEDQMQVEPGSATLTLPSGAHIVEYLIRNARFEGVGRATADRLWETFKEGLVDVLDGGDYQALADVVSPQKAAALIEGWQEEGLSKTLQWLQANGVGLAIGRRIVAYFGSEAVAKIGEQPYRLLSFAAHWDEVDSLAVKQLGVDPHDERRLAAAVEEVVYRQFSRGDTFVPRKDLVIGLRRLLEGEDHSKSVVEAAIEYCEKTGRLLFDGDGNAYSLGASILENRVVECIQIRSGLRSPACNVNGIIAAFEDSAGFPLNPEQRAAIHLVADNHFSVITGGAGCGKTTVLSAVCEVLESQGYEVVQLALAGKAVKRMMEATGRPAMTLASFINKLMRSNENGDLDPSVPVAILIDEASMVDLISFSTLARLIRDQVKIALIGDPHQLPPVGPGLVLHCLTAAQSIPHVELKDSNRFGSEIAHIANGIRDGRLPSLAGNGSVTLIEVRDDQIPECAAKLYLDQPTDSVVLSSTRSVAAAINQRVQEALAGGRREVRVWNEEFDCWEAAGLREGDVVICTRNHWDLGIQNGSMGRVSSVETGADDAMGEIEWDDGVVRVFDVGLLDSLKLGYALTVHKSQGSQWGRVVVCLPSSSRMVDRSLIYTAITRAQRQVVLLGQAEHLAEVIGQRKAADRRRVGLPKRLSQMYPNHP